MLTGAERAYWAAILQADPKAKSEGAALRQRIRKCVFCEGLLDLENPTQVFSVLVADSRGHDPGCPSLRLDLTALGGGGEPPGGGGGGSTDDVTLGRSDITLGNPDVTLSTLTYPAA